MSKFSRQPLFLSDFQQQRFCNDHIPTTKKYTDTMSRAMTAAQQYADADMDAEGGMSTCGFVVDPDPPYTFPDHATSRYSPTTR